jgi:hypothetical protein
VTAGILYLLPALVLALVLFARRYPGERVLARLRRPRPGRRWRAAVRPCCRTGDG